MKLSQNFGPQLPTDIESDTLQTIADARLFGRLLILITICVKVLLLILHAQFPNLLKADTPAASWPLLAPTMYPASIMCVAVCATNNVINAPSKRFAAVSASDPLPSWNDGPLKNSIIDFVKNATDSSKNTFVPIEDRIATFDNDGTLWAEQPVIELEYAKTAFKRMIQKNPGLAGQQPYKAIIAKDRAYLATVDESILATAILKALSGSTEAQFDSSVKAYFDTAHYVFQKRVHSIQDATYQPQLELLKYLRNNGFKTFICSGGTIEFMRAISLEYYGVPPEQVIGTKLQYRFDETTRKIIRDAKILSICDKAGKPVNIQWHIGKIPVFACGNVRSGGDIQMLKFSQTNKYPNFQLMVNHDDAVREFAYKEKDNASLAASAAGKWHVVSMKNDWKEIFSAN